jgi:hypothetical protein
VAYAVPYWCCAGCRQHLRELLDVGDGDDNELEQMSIGVDDPDEAVILEYMAAQMSDDDVEDYCFAMEEPAMAAMIRAYSNPDNNGAPAECRCAGITPHCPYMRLDLGLPHKPLCKGG